MRQQPLDYQRQILDVQTLQWRWDYSKDDWEAVLSAAGGDEFKLRRDTDGGAVFAQHGGETWSLRVRGSVQAHRYGEDRVFAMLHGREIRFAEGRTVLMDSGKWYRLTLNKQLSFLRD